MVDLFIESVSDEWRALVLISPRLILAIVVMIVSLVAGLLTRRAASYWLARADMENTKKAYFSRIIGWIPLVIGLLIALSILKLEAMAAGLLAGGGLIAVVFGFAFRQIGENFLAGFILAMDRPFREKDYIRCSGYEGTVQDIQLRYTHIRTPDGRDIFIPNARIFTEPLENFTLDGLRRFEWTFGIDYRDDAGRACALIRERINAISEIQTSPAVRVSVAGLDGNWQQLVAQFWLDVTALGECLPDKRTEVAEAIRKTLLENGFTPSAEVTTNISLVKEGEPAARAASSE